MFLPKRLLTEFLIGAISQTTRWVYQDNDTQVLRDALLLNRKVAGQLGSSLLLWLWRVILSAFSLRNSGIARALCLNSIQTPVSSVGIDVIARNKAPIRARHHTAVGKIAVLH